MTTVVNQPSALPTNKLTTAGALFVILTALDTYGEGVIGEWLAEIGFLATKPATVAVLSIAIKAGIPLLVAYFVRDRANTAPAA